MQGFCLTSKVGTVECVAVQSTFTSSFSVYVHQKVIWEGFVLHTGSRQADHCKA